MSTAKITAVGAVIAIISLGLVGASVIAAHIDATATPAAVSSAGGVGVGKIAQPAAPVGDGSDGRTAPAAVSSKADGSTPVNGLKLILGIDKTELVIGADGEVEPVRFSLTFVNVSKKPFNLSRWVIGYNHLRLHVVGPDGKVVEPLAGFEKLRQIIAATAKDFPTIQPGGRLPVMLPKDDCSFPGHFAMEKYAMPKSGQYELHVSYKNPGVWGPAENKQLKPSWRGEVTSNKVALTVREPAAGKPVDGLKLTLAVEKPQALVMPTGVKTEPIRLKITFANVSERPITLGVGKGSWDGNLSMTALGADVKAKVQIGRTVNHSLGEDGKAFVTIKPGGTFVCKHEVSPQDVENRTAAGAGLERGRYRFEFTYNYPAKIGDWPAERKAGRWVGTASSNPVELTLAPGGANVGAKAKQVFVKLVNASRRPLEGGKQAEAWIQAETAEHGYTLAYNQAGWTQLSYTKRHVYSSMQGGRVVWARMLPGVDNKGRFRLKVTGFKVVLAPITLTCSAGEHQIVQLTRYDDDSNLFLAVSVGGALGAETKPAVSAKR